jgi:hypothetical protein
MRLMLGKRKLNLGRPPPESRPAEQRPRIAGLPHGRKTCLPCAGSGQKPRPPARSAADCLTNVADQAKPAKPWQD